MIRNQILAIIALFIGETLAIYSELLIARGSSWAWTFFVITVAGVPLLIGYKLGAQCFTTLWPVLVVSVTSIAIVEPLLLLFWLKQAPSWGSVAGLCLGVLGMFLAIKY
jgi:hypothetical protein